MGNDFEQDRSLGSDELLEMKLLDGNKEDIKPVNGIDSTCRSWWKKMATLVRIAYPN